MQPEERLKNWKLHDSIRGWFGRALYEEMAKDERIYILTGDLGYGLLDAHRDDFPKRFVNVGASEQLLIGAGVGLALDGKIPFCYSISTFLIYRPYEWLGNYLNWEKIPVRLVGSGYEDDYEHDGMTHQPYGLYELFGTQFWNINYSCPGNKESVPDLVRSMISENRPSFLCLRR